MNALSILASVTLIKILSSKKVRKSIEQKQPIPQKAKRHLSDTMQMCKDLSLTVPGSLQARALEHAAVNNIAVSSS